MQTEQLKKDLGRAMAGSAMSALWEKTLSAVVACPKAFWQAGRMKGVPTVNGAIQPLILIFTIFPLLMRTEKNHHKIQYAYSGH